jgi:hypothetical protein
LPRLLGRREQILGYKINDSPIHFLWKWSLQVIRTQPCLNVTDGNASMKARDACNKSCRRVSLRKHYIWLDRYEKRVEFLKNSRGQPIQALIGAHYIQIGVRLDIKYVEYLIQHLTMLSR